jgi:hypothetical protein
MSLRRFWISTLLAPAIGLLLCACAGSTGASTQAQAGSRSATAKTVSAHRASAPAAPPSRAQALAFARAVNLTVGDIPEASIETQKAHDSDTGERHALHACERSFPPSHTLAQASSPKLRRGAELEIERVTSSVQVLRGEVEADRQLALLGMAALRECAARALTASLRDKPIRQARWGRVKLSKLHVSAPGASATVGIRILATLNLPFSEVTVPIYVDVLGFAIGHAEVALTALSVTQPVPANTEQELLALLLARAKATPL